MIKIIHLVSVVVVVVKYYLAPQNISQEYICSILLIVLINTIAFYRKKDRRNFYKERFLNNTNIFIILYIVVSFQIPLDYALGNDLINYDNYFYDMSTVNQSVSFSSLCLVAFFLGAERPKLPKHMFLQDSKHTSNTFISVRPIFIIMVVLWSLFILFMNPAYINGGHGTVLVNGISIACYSYFWRINIVYLAISLLNNKKRGLRIIDIVRTQPVLYWCIIILSSLLFLMAHNRVYVLYLLVPCFFYFQILSRIKLGVGKSLLIILCLTVFFTLFKLYGLSNMFSSSSNLNVTELNNYDRFASISPFTSELAASKFSDTVLFHLWYHNGIMAFGSTFVFGVLRIISGLVPLFFMITGLTVDTYDTASMATIYVGAPYGLGSTVTGDLLLSVGFVFSIITMYIFGYCCSRADVSLIRNQNYSTPLLLIILLSFSSQIIFVTRGSLCDTIATTLFCIFFFNIYNYFINKRSSNV